MTRFGGLVRQRQIWWPTWRGGALLLVSLGALGFALVSSAYTMLSPHDPVRTADGQGARTLVVEGWLSADELRQALVAFRAGHYERVLTTGGPIDAQIDVGGWKNFAVRAAIALRADGLTGAPVIPVPAPETSLERTWLSAVAVDEWARHGHVALGSIDVFSAGVHARRSWLLYRMVFAGTVPVGVLAAQRTDDDEAHWWRSSAGAKNVLGEAISLTWTKCCFWPDRPGEP